MNQRLMEDKRRRRIVRVALCSVDDLPAIVKQFYSQLVVVVAVVKPPPPVGAGGGYMFSGRPSVRASVRASVRPSVRPSVIHVVVLCFRDISSIC